MKQKHHIRIPQETNDKLAELMELLDLNKTEVAIIAIDEYYVRKIVPQKRIPQSTEENAEAPSKTL